MSLKTMQAFNPTPTAYEVIQEGPVSTVSRTQLDGDGRDPSWAAVKSAPTRNARSAEPHDIIKELRVLSGISHPNVISVLGHAFREKHSPLQFWMPYVPHSLAALLASPAFSPHPLAGGAHDAPRDAQFSLLAKSLLFQILAALAHLHRLRIAHRDVKPHNVLLTSAACVKLIDFGIAWKADDGESAKQEDLWPEYADKMYFEVSTGPYRAPELLFGTRSYDAFAIDLWSLGATFAEFFTTLRLCSLGYDDDADPAVDAKDSRDQPFVIPPTMRAHDPETGWFRDSLFNGERGEIGLAWSIFKVFGTPTEETWPSFADLPNASGITFNTVPPVNLSSLLPNLPSSCTQTLSHPDEAMTTPSPLDLLKRLLAYTPAQRLQAATALRHPWLSADPPVLLPSEYRSASTDPDVLQHFPATTWQEKDLGEWLRATLSVTDSS